MHSLQKKQIIEQYFNLVLINAKYNIFKTFSLVKSPQLRIKNPKDFKQNKIKDDICSTKHKVALKLTPKSLNFVDHSSKVPSVVY